MDPNRIKGAAAIDKGLSLFLAILQADGTSLSELAKRARIPDSTAQRFVGAFLRRGLLSRTGRGRYRPGLRLVELAGAVEMRQVLADASRPLLRQLGRILRTTVHLGVLEGDMVTYLVKERGGGPELLTREANQLEAYCSGIGKVLLAHLDEQSRELYLAGGPFVVLTPNTMTDPGAIREALSDVAARGYATDRAEFEERLFCLAVPVHGPGDRIIAALSASSAADHCDDPHWLQQLQLSAKRIGQRLGATRPWRTDASRAKIQRASRCLDTIDPL